MGAPASNGHGAPVLGLLLLWALRRRANSAPR
jgi:MYXO-CTERM domain-containing protein